MRKIHKCPIGKYTIKLFLSDMYGLSVKITRNEGQIKQFHHPHIDTRDGSDGRICWGNIKGEIEVVCRNKDWYWAARMSLDLLEDGELEAEHHNEQIKQFLGFQISYLEQAGKDHTQVYTLLIRRYKIETGWNYHGYYS